MATLLPYFVLSLNYKKLCAMGYGFKKLVIFGIIECELFGLRLLRIICNMTYAH